MIKYIYVFDAEQAKSFSELGFKYSKSKINGQEVSVFQADNDIIDALSTKFANYDFFISDKLIF